RRREHVPDVPSDHPAQRVPGAGRARDPPVPGVVERVPVAAHRGALARTSHAPARAGLVPGTLRRELALGACRRDVQRRADHPARDLLPEVLHPERGEQRDQGLVRLEDVNRWLGPLVGLSLGLAACGSPNVASPPTATTASIRWSETTAPKDVVVPGAQWLKIE